MKFKFTTVLTELKKDIIYEIVAPHEVPFGIDNNFSDNKIGELNPQGIREFYWTVFHLRQKKYLVLLDKEGQIKFNVIDDIPTNEEEWYSFFKYNRVKTSNPFIVFGSVLYIISNMLKHVPLQEVYFSGHDKDLQQFYEKLVWHGIFKNEIKKIGFEFKEQDKQGNLIFSRLKK